MSWIVEGSKPPKTKSGSCLASWPMLGLMIVDNLARSVDGSTLLHFLLREASSEWDRKIGASHTTLQREATSNKESKSIILALELLIANSHEWLVCFRA